VIARSHTLLDGTRIRLRLPHGSDRLAVEALLHRAGRSAGEVDVRRRMHFDPRDRVVVVATAWEGAIEALVGIGAVWLEKGALPEDLAVDPTYGAPLEALLRDVLASRAADALRVA